jgi:hypothetical protein
LALSRRMRFGLHGDGGARETSLHHNTIDRDVVTGGRVFGPDTATMSFGSRTVDLNVLNLVTGLHFELANDSNLRIAGAIPLTSSRNRFFDSELSLQISRKY